MCSSLRLRFVHHVADPKILIFEGSAIPAIGQRLRAVGSQGNGFSVVAILAHDQLPKATNLAPQSFGLKLKYNEIPWAPGTPIEIL